MILFIVILKILLYFLIVSVVHELTHYVFAKIYKREQVKININKVYAFSVSYKNNHNSVQNLIISLSAPLVCVIIGLIYFKLGYFNILTIVFLINIINFFPVTRDGQVILISLINIIKNSKTKNDEKY
ncbi:metalloprotease family protein [Staphylococcus xylosus]